MMNDQIERYLEGLHSSIRNFDKGSVQALAEDIFSIWRAGRHLFLCGNGGSAGNAIHLANDFLVGIASGDYVGMKVEALSANPSVITCLANDIGYENIFSHQLRVKAEAGDLLLALSGSGNSENIVSALKTGNDLEMKTFALVGFDGGVAKELAGRSIHFSINDMQIAEDLQLVVGHLCMRLVKEMARID